MKRERENRGMRKRCFKMRREAKGQRDWKIVLWNVAGLCNKNE